MRQSSAQTPSAPPGHPVFTRRFAIQAGALGLLGLGVDHLAALRKADAVEKPARHQGRARSVIYIFLSGGLAQLDSFDPKPDAPEGVRGEFRSIATRTPGVHVCEHLPLLAAARESIHENLEDSKLLFKIIQGMFARRVSVKNLSGPVGIAQQIDLAAQYGKWTLVRLVSSISLQLGILNLLPIPILDGGMILFLLIESAFRRDLNQQVKERIYQAAFVFLVVFAVMVLYNDLLKTLPGLAQRLP